MTHPERKSFPDEVNALAEAFVKGQRDGESNADVWSAMLELILQRERVRHGVNVGTKKAAALDEATLAKMKSWDSDDPTMLLLEKIFRRLATNRGDDAHALLERAIADRTRAVSEDQRRKAKAPRRKNPVVTLIEDIVRGKSDISREGLDRALRAQSGKGVIFDIDEEFIYPADESFKGIRVDGLKDQLTRAKRRLAKAG